MWPLKLKISWPGALLVIGFIGFIALKVLFSFPRFSDGAVYMYLAKLISAGVVPYRDFFYSSPPLIPYLFAGYGSVAGFSWPTFNLLPILFSVIDGLLLYTILKRFYAPMAGLVGALLYLFSFAVLATTDFVSDVHTVTTLVVLSFFAITKQKPFFAGGLLGLAAVAKVYAIVLLPAWIVYYLWNRRWLDSLVVTLGFLSLFGAVTIVFWQWLGPVYFDQVFVSHFGYIEGIPKWPIVSFFVRHDWFLLAGLLLSVYWYVAYNRRPSPLIFIASLCLLAFYFLFSDIYYLYWKLLVVWLAVWAAWSVHQTYHFLRLRLAHLITAVLIVGSVLVPTWLYVTQQARAAIITDYEAIVIALKEDRGEPIYGDYEITPLLAIDAARPLFKNYVDTNPKFFWSGYFDLRERAQEIRENAVQTIITKALISPDGKILNGPERVLPLSFFQSYCKAKKVFPIEQDYSHNAVVVWECRYPNH